MRNVHLDIHLCLHIHVLDFLANAAVEVRFKLFLIDIDTLGLPHTRFWSHDMLWACQPKTRGKWA